MIYEYQKHNNIDFKLAWEKGFNRKISISTYDWIFCSKNNVFVYEDLGNIVGGYCLMPLDLQINNKPYSGHLCNNIFVHLVAGFKYQRDRVFEQLTEFCYDKNSSNWIAFPNINSLSSHLSNGWKKVLNLNIFECQKNQRLLCGLNENIKIIKEQFDDFSKVASNVSLLSKNSFSVNKSESFLKSRYVSNPQYLYDYFIIYYRDEPIGFLIVKFFPERKRLHIVDFNFSKLELCNFDKLICLIHKEYEHLNFNVIDILESPIFRNKLNASKFFKRSSVFISMIVKGNNLDKVNFDSAHIVFGDNEVY